MDAVAAHPLLELGQAGYLRLARFLGRKQKIIILAILTYAALC